MTNEGRLPKIILFGDSLTEWAFKEINGGFGWVLQQKYAGKAEIENEGVAGFTSTMLKANFKDILKRATRETAPPTLLITIFLGANDAAYLPVEDEENQGLQKFHANICEFVELVLIEDGLRDTKIVLITPPPINIPKPVQDIDIGPAAAVARAEITGNDPKRGIGYRVYLNKKAYAEKTMEIAKTYEETGRVIGLNLWGALIDAALDDQNRLGDEDAYSEERLPGCGLEWAENFKKGYFTDGLHFGPLAYDILSKQLLEVMLQKWPELSPDRIQR